MNKLGIITEVKDDIALVMVAKSEACGTSCGCGALTRMGGRMEQDDHHYVKVKNTINGEIGDPVNIEFATNKLLSTSALVYLVPLIMLVVGIIIGNAVQGQNPSDLVSFLVGVVALVASYLILSMIDKKKDKEELITITEFRGF